VTSVAKTLLDLAAILSFRQVRRSLAQADYLGLLNAEEIAAVLGKGRRGSKALRRAVALHLPQLAETLSALEERFLELCEVAGVPIPEVNAKVGRMRVDAVWREVGLAVELVGAAAHGGWGQVSRDRERELVLRREGFQVVRYTWKQITERATEVATDLRGLLAL
jgi:hypothetical protein